MSGFSMISNIIKDIKYPQLLMGMENKYNYKFRYLKLFDTDQHILCAMS